MNYTVEIVLAAPRGENSHPITAPICAASLVGQ